MFSDVRKWIFKRITVRHPLMILCFFANVYMIAFRLCMSLALVAMNSQPNRTLINELNDTSDHCPITANSSVAKEMSMNKHFHWNNYEQGVILSSYFYGFLSTQILGGVLCQKWSAKYTMTISIGVSAILTLLCPLAAHHGYYTFVTVRVLVGLFSGCILSCVYAQIGCWIPINSRAFHSSLTYSGTNFGAIIAIAISGPLSNLRDNEEGWPYIFYFFGTASLLFIPFWLLVAWDHPEDHPFISKEELDFLSKEIKSTHQETITIPWLTILTSMPFIALSVANFGHNWILDFLQLQLPTYMAQALNYKIASNSLVSALPFLLKTATNFLSGGISDFCYRRFNWSTTFLRKLFNTLAFFGASIFLFGVTLADCDGPLNVAILCLATFFTGVCSAGFICTYVDLCRELSGVMLGLSNTVGNLAGLIAPHLIGYITNEGSSLSQWRICFYLTAAVFVATGAFFLVFGSSEDQNYLKKTKESADNETSQEGHQL